jgi:hypothetical protein
VLKKFSFAAQLRKMNWFLADESLLGVVFVCEFGGGFPQLL